MKDKIVYSEKYCKGVMLIDKAALPKSLPFVEDGAKIEEIEVTEAGKILRGDQEFEYVVCRILLK